MTEMKSLWMPPLTEEQKDLVREYFKNGAKENNPKMFIRYGRMKNWGEIIEKAEQMIKEAQQRKEDWYKRYMNKQIKENMEAYKQRFQEDGNYQLLKLNHWDDWRTMVLWIEGMFDIETKRQKREQVIEIEERRNPAYFQEVANRFNVNLY
jgi:hypothetical protein